MLWGVHDAGLSRPLTFHSKSGVLTAARESGAISLDFPAEPAMPVPPEQAGEYASLLVRAFGLPSRDAVLWVGRDVIGGPGGGDLIAEVTLEAFAQLRPEPSEIARSGSALACRVLSVCCAGCPAGNPR